MVHTNTFLCAYHDEGAYCSGHGSTANTPEELVAADLTAIDRCLSFKVGLPKPQREELFHLASGLTPDAVMTKSVGPGEGSLQAYFQTSIFYDWAVSATIGAMGTSKAFRYYSPYAAAEKDIYGCLVKKWELVVDRSKPMYQNVDFLVSQAKTASTTPIVGGIPAFSTAASQVFNGATITVDSKTTANMRFTSLRFLVENTFAEGEEASGLSSVYADVPQLLERNIEFEISYLTNGSDTWDADELNTTVQTVSATLALGVFTLSPVNYNVWETNQDELDGRGVVKRTAKFRRGVSSTQAKT